MVVILPNNRTIGQVCILQPQKPIGVTSENLELMQTMDHLFTQDSTPVVLGMQDELVEQGMKYNVKRSRRLLRKMGVEPIYPKKNLSRLGKLLPLIHIGFPVYTGIEPY